MKRFGWAAGLCFGAMFAQAQATSADQELLKQARAKYDAPFERHLQSFECGGDFSWRQHFTETARVGDEGTDEELERLFQPIRNRVTVTREKVTVTPDLSEEAIEKLPHGGMAEFLLEHAVERSLSTWLPASTNGLLPDEATPVRFVKIPAGYRLAFTKQGAAIEMNLTAELGLESAALKAPGTDRFETTFAEGPQGFLLTSWTAHEDGNTGPGHRLMFGYTYQVVDGVQLPEHVTVIRESHQEVWRYTLSGCVVKAGK